MKHNLLLLSFLFLIGLASLNAQRNFYFFDSTNYKVSESLSLHASKYKLYATKNGNLQLLKDFKGQDTNYYIRDVDFFDEDHYLVLIGRNTIGFPTQLFVSKDAGKTWKEDTSFFSVSEHKSLNQLQVLGKDTLLLFDGYYQSDVLRSFDRGKTWQKWIASLIAHYFQVHFCSKTNLYCMIGLPGDAFGSVSFEIPDSVWKASNLNFMSGCHNNRPGCYRVFYGQNIWKLDFISEHKKYIDSICLNKSTGIRENIGSNQNVLAYPNPAEQFVIIEAWKGEEISIFAITGELIVTRRCDSNGFIELSDLQTGIYLFQFGQNQIRISKN